MEVNISYSKTQLEEAVKFIAKNNDHFIGQIDYIRNSIIRTMYDMVNNQKITYTGTMGYLIISDWEMEGIDFDRNVCRFDIYIDPGLGKDCFNESNIIEEIVNASNDNKK